MVIILIIIIIVIGVVIFVLNRKNTNVEEIRSLFGNIYRPDAPLKINVANNMLKMYLVKRFGEDAVKLYNSKTLPLTCVDPDYDIVTLLNIEKKNPVEWERLKQCGYLYNTTLFLMLVTYLGVDLKSTNFNDMMNKAIEISKEDLNEIAPSPAPSPTPSLPFSLRYRR